MGTITNLSSMRDTIVDNIEAMRYFEELTQEEIERIRCLLGMVDNALTVLIKERILEAERNNRDIP